MDGAISIGGTGSRSRRRERRANLALALLVAPAVVFVGATVVVPTLMAFVDSFKHEGAWGVVNYVSFVRDAPYLRVLANTLLIAVVVTAACVLACAPAAAFLSTQDSRKAALLIALVAASLWVSVLVRIYSWQVFLAKAGPLNVILQSLGIIDKPLPLLYTRGAVVISMVQFLVPYALMMLYAGMRRVDWELVVAARSLGARSWTVFSEVYWPQVRFSVVTTALVVFMIATSFFVSPALLGGPRDTMLGMQMHSDLVNRYETGMSPTTGVVLTVLLLLVSWICLRLGGTSFRRLARDITK